MIKVVPPAKRGRMAYAVFPSERYDKRIYVGGDGLQKAIIAILRQSKFIETVSVRWEDVPMEAENTHDKESEN